jgi:hypothetical protein
MIISTPGSVIRGRKNLGTYRFPNEKEAYEMCCAFSGALSKLYPGFMWGASINQDILFIQNCTLDHVNAYSINLADIDPEGRVLARIAGEILERYGVSRGHAKKSEIKNLKYDELTGNAPQI